MIVEAPVDQKGRILIPVDIREELGITENTRVAFEIKKIKQSPSLVDECRGLFKKEMRDSVEVIRKESPFR